MSHFYSLKLNKWKRWSVIVVAALFSAIFVWAEKDSAFSVFSTDKGPRALVSSGENEDEVSLTFNISWGQEEVFPILETLKKHDAKATFFVSGEWAERHPEILQAIQEDQHEIGMMGYRYKSYIDQEPAQVKKDLLYAKGVFDKIGLTDIEYLRPPSGKFNDDVLKLAEQLGYQVVQWSVNPEDWRNPGTQKIVDHVMKDTKGGDIIVLHASDSVKQTEEALRTILPGLKNKGYTFATISELVSKAEAQSKRID
ncbi:polysaccharide deacetylase [Pontibacillus halophilus JSM 076056 = DSM 19796]|uniref:Polysaccharide deacetylase n=1 Tax=Pontibacillus halophilus JSM 076056 = DSM 19796 TaxID=1385510 RepID=A0A0A5GGV6_9BACI|nr:polysaccharide deacetylase family sporulation protein PdaB [Pontibacillus halophilus]KGX90350.1 polysaccharide deacetylase [Pontibacillus halophilus JSM 076056 = DSM 19796]